MNGASAEPWLATRINPNSTSTTTMGASQYFLLVRRNCQNSVRIAIFAISKHPFEVLRIALPRGIRLPVRLAPRRPPLERIGSGPPFDHTNRGDREEEDGTEQDPRRDERQRLGQHHPTTV